MPRNGSGVASKPAGTTAVPDTTIESNKYNSVIDDVYDVINDVNPEAIDINGGTIDGTVIGGSSAAAGSFTTLTASSTATFGTVDINGGAIDGAIIGANSAAAVTATTVTAGAATVSGATPTITLTDTDTGGDTVIDASNTTGSLTISIDNGNEVASSTLIIKIDGANVLKVDASGNLTVIGNVQAYGTIS